MRVLNPLAVLAAMSLAGCGHSPATTFLVIDPAPPTGAPLSTYAGPPLRVPFVHLPVTVDRPELVRQDAAGTIVVEDFARWSAPLGLLARGALVQNLTARLPAGAVLPPDAPAAAREVRVEATILSFAAAAGEATMTVSYRLVRPGTDPQPSVARLTTALADDAPAGRAQAWSRMLAQLSDRIVSQLLVR